MIKRFKLEGGKVAEWAPQAEGPDAEGAAPAQEAAAPILVFIAPDEAERRELVERHGIDPHNLHSALDPDEMGRIEQEPDHLVLILKRPRNYCSSDNFLFRVVSMGVFLYSSKMVIVIADDLAIFEGKHSFALKSLHDVLIKLIYSTIHHLNGHLKVINMLSEELERKINTSMENKYLLCMFTLEKSLVYFLNAVNSNAAQIEKLKHGAAKLGFSQDNVELLDDISLDNQQCLAQVQTYSNILSGLMDAWASVINNNVNVVLKRLTAVTIAIAVPSFVAGVGGMSEFTEMVGREHIHHGFALVTAAMVLLGVGSYFLIDRWMANRPE